MKIARRQFLSVSTAACAALAAPPPKPRGKFDDGRLGVMCVLPGPEGPSRSVLAAARAAGFRRVQVNFHWGKATPEFLRAFPAWLKDEGLKLEVLSAYVNCCRPEVVLNDCSRADFSRAIEYAAGLGCRHLTAWTGGYSASSLQKPDPQNFTPEASAAIRRFLESQAPALEKAGITLALETFVSMACPDAASLAAVLEGLPRCFGAVFDPPNLTALSRFAQRDEVLREMARLLSARFSVVHLKDFTLVPGAARYTMPRALAGDMNYPLFVRAALALPDSTPLIAEHCTPEEFVVVRRTLLPVLAAAAGEKKEPS